MWKHVCLESLFQGTMQSYFTLVGANTYIPVYTVLLLIFSTRQKMPQLSSVGRNESCRQYYHEYIPVYTVLHCTYTPLRQISVYVPSAYYRFLRCPQQSADASIARQQPIIISYHRDALCFWIYLVSSSTLDYEYIYRLDASQLLHDRPTEAENSQPRKHRKSVRNTNLEELDGIHRWIDQALEIIEYK